jgi:hypothetical protein
MRAALFNLIPLTRARGVVTDFDNEARFVGKALKLQLPQPRPGTIAAATIGSE